VDRLTDAARRRRRRRRGSGGRRRISRLPEPAECGRASPARARCAVLQWWIQPSTFDYGSEAQLSSLVLVLAVGE